jgi:hypothetical protein
MLFVGTLRDASTTSVLFLLFGLAVISVFGGLIAFVAEMLMASIGLRERAERAAEKSAEGEAESEDAEAESSDPRADH